MEFKIDDIFERKEKNLFGGYQTILEIGIYTVVIAGGHKFQGDFKDTFQIIIFNDFGDYVTKKVIPSANQDILGWVDKEHLMEIINSIPN